MSKPDWTLPFGVVSPVYGSGAPETYDGNYAASWDYSSPGVEVEDRVQSTESGDATIWAAYEIGY